MTYKQVEDKDALDGVRESEIEVSSFELTKGILDHMGMKQKAYQETFRETWSFNHTEVTIDERPGLKPFIEIEGENEEIVQQTCMLLGFDMSNAVFGSVSQIYIIELGMTPDHINNLPLITFENPPLSMKNQII